MNPLSAIMGAADIICMGLVLYAYGINVFTILLAIIMISKGVMSFFG